MFAATLFYQGKKTVLRRADTIVFHEDTVRCIAIARRAVFLKWSRDGTYNPILLDDKIVMMHLRDRSEFRLLCELLAASHGFELSDMLRTGREDTGPIAYKLI